MVEHEEHAKGSLHWRVEVNRLLSFSSWPLNGKRRLKATPENLAKAGFYHTPTADAPDNCTCAYCGKALDGWEASDDPMEEHKSHMPKCCFVNLDVEAARLETFAGFWDDTERPTATALAYAGFYFYPLVNSDDNVKCFRCGKELDGWEADDDPIAEHARNTKCKYLTALMKRKAPPEASDGPVAKKPRRVLARKKVGAGKTRSKVVEDEDDGQMEENDVPQEQEKAPTTKRKRGRPALKDDNAQAAKIKVVKKAKPPTKTKGPKGRAKKTAVKADNEEDESAKAIKSEASNVELGNSTPAEGHHLDVSGANNGTEVVMQDAEGCTRAKGGGFTDTGRSTEADQVLSPTKSVSSGHRSRRTRASAATQPQVGTDHIVSSENERVVLKKEKFTVKQNGPGAEGENAVDKIKETAVDDKKETLDEGNFHAVRKGETNVVRETEIVTVGVETMEEDSVQPPDNQDDVVEDVLARLRKADPNMTVEKFHDQECDYQISVVISKANKMIDEFVEAAQEKRRQLEQLAF